MNVEQLIKKDIEINDFMQKLEKECQEVLVPYKEASKTIRALLLNILNEQGGEHISTAHGTVYKSEHMSTKVVDANAFLDYVFDNDARHLITAAAAKKAVKEFMDEYQGLPPGVETTTFIKCNIRRS